MTVGRGYIMNRSFLAADILLPKNADLEKWAVIACDQHTSDREYWNRVKEKAAGVPSALHMILPEADLESATDETIAQINQRMAEYLASGVFTTYDHAFVYVERTLQNGMIRQGILGAVDLEGYDNSPDTDAPIRATEKTVIERIPPRVAVRKGAYLEFTHVILFCDDIEKQIVESVAAKRDTLPQLYSFDLMENGGHIAGWLVSGQDAQELEQLLDVYEQNHTYLVGDGNHSLVTAKRCYEDLKGIMPEEVRRSTPARYALVELENIYSPSISFEPIYRIITQTDPEKMLEDLRKISADAGEEITWITQNGRGTIRLNVAEFDLVVGVLQRFLDAWLQDNSGEIDYIHGEDALTQMAVRPNAVGFLLPEFVKGKLFPYILSGRVLPRKTFSLGHGDEKRFYLEGRKIK